LKLSNSHLASITAGNMYIEGGIHLDHARVEGAVNLIGARINGIIECEGSHFINKGKETILAKNLKVGSDIRLNAIISEGEINLTGAQVDGDLQCVYAKLMNKNKIALMATHIIVKGGIFMNGAISEGIVDFRSAIISRFEAQQAHFSNKDDIALAIETAKVNGPIFLDNAKIKGQLRLASSIIGGVLQCDGAQFINEGKSALFALQTEVHGNVLLRDVTAMGEVSFGGAKIDGVLECDRSQFINKGANALFAEGLKATGGIHLHDNFKAEGAVRLLNSILDNDLYCTKGHFLNERGEALIAEHIKIKGKAFFSSIEVKGLVSFASAEIDGHFKWTDVPSNSNVILDLRYAKIGTLWDDEASWPTRDHLWLNGLVYENIDSKAPRSFKSRIKWLKLQPTERFYPQPYDQLARVYNKAGQDNDAKRVLIEKNKDPLWLSQMTRWEKFWQRFLGITIGFGYRPFHALYWIFLLIVIGWGVFSVAAITGIMTPSKEGAYISEAGVAGRQLSTDYPKFNSLIYSVDLFIPVIDLHMKNYWLPNANNKSELRISNRINIPISGSIIRIWFWLHIILGWILITLFIVGLTGLIKK
jgi:hypothetical protein